MMNIFKEKLTLWSPVIVLTVLFVFCLTLIPSVNPTPVNLPIAIVNEDKGIQLPNQPKMNMGETVVQNIESKSQETEDGKEPAIDWIEVASEEEAREGLNNKKYYAAFIIPADFSQKQASFQTLSPSSPEVKILINQGMNASAANIAGQVLNTVADNLNNSVRSQLLAGFEKQGGTITTQQASLLVSPVTREVENINEVGTHSANGNAPVLLFQPLWMAGIAGAVILNVVTNKLIFANRKEKITAKVFQVLTGGVLSLLVGFGMTWIVDALIGIDIPQFTDTALFLSIAYFSFFLLMSAVISWLGAGGSVILILTLFFGGPLLAMAPEVMSPFYRDWIYSWLPMRFMIEGLRELLFFGKAFSWNHAVSVLIGIGLVSLLAVLASFMKLNGKNGKNKVVKAS
jgi:YhgE/Pip-like protein